MTVLNETKKVIANGNGSSTSFSFSPMLIQSSDMLEVIKTDVDGAVTTLVEGSGSTNYTVVVSDYPGTGSVTYPSTGSTRLETGETLTMKRSVDNLQETDLKNQGGYYPDVLEAALDKLTYKNLELEEVLDRTVKAPTSDTVELELPSETSRASKLLGFDADGQFSTIQVTPGEVTVSAFAETLLDDADAAAFLTTLGISANGQSLIQTDYSGMITLLGLGTVVTYDEGTTEGDVALLGTGDVFDISLLPTTVHNSEITGTVQFDEVTGDTWTTGLNTYPHGLGEAPDEVTIKLVCTDAGGENGFAQDDFLIITPYINHTNTTSNNSGYNTTNGLGLFWDDTNVYITVYILYIISQLQELMQHLLHLNGDLIYSVKDINIKEKRETVVSSLPFLSRDLICPLEVSFYRLKILVKITQISSSTVSFRIRARNEVLGSSLYNSEAILNEFINVVYYCQIT